MTGVGGGVGAHLCSGSLDVVGSAEETDHRRVQPHHRPPLIMMHGQMARTERRYLVGREATHYLINQSEATDHRRLHTTAGTPEAAYRPVIFAPVAVGTLPG